MLKQWVWMCLTSMCVASAVRAEDHMGKVISFRQAIVAGEYDVDKLRHEFEGYASSRTQAELTDEWFHEVEEKVQTAEQRVGVLMARLSMAREYRLRNSNEMSAGEAELIQKISTPLRFLYVYLKRHKQDLYRYYAKKVAEKRQTRHLWHKFQRMGELEQLRRYHRHEVARVENKLERFLQLFVEYTDGLDSVDQQIAAVGKVLGEGTVLDEELEDCPICLETMRPGACGQTIFRLNACKHTFHQQCVVGWLAGQNTCPLCRAEVAPAP
ncbi:MAG: hypothetical protein OXT67_06225 [Zetaproteobacteria bacterium]|nr:hypothetical protein [Zetaproteobacteria bacterium]